MSRISDERPDWAPTLQALVDEYITLRYAELGSRTARRQFIRNVARFRPRR